jgi:DNA-directed RNA polymerase subunit RPC12/RpoP
MDEQTFEGNYGRAVVLDLCQNCHGIWFDAQESLSLTPGAILRLFSILAEKQTGKHQSLPEGLQCPRCSRLLVKTTDVQRSTRFHYFRCPQEQGRFITFFQFLREKNFVRSLDERERAALRQHLTTLNCSNCGAPIDLANDFACSYCRTPVSTLDPRQLEMTLRQLQRAEDQRRTNDSMLPIELLLKRIERNAKPSPNDSIPAMTSSFLDLLEVGVSAVVDMLADAS